MVDEGGTVYSREIGGEIQQLYNKIRADFMRCRFQFPTNYLKFMKLVFVPFGGGRGDGCGASEYNPILYLQDRRAVSWQFKVRFSGLVCCSSLCAESINEI